MTYEQARKEIQSHFATNFTELSSDRLAWDNVAFSIPKDDKPWIRVSVQNNISNYVSVGSLRQIRREGVVSIQVFTVENTETLTASRIVDNIVDVFETHLANKVRFRSPNVQNIGISDGWYQVNIAVSFYFDDFKSYN